ncbi:ABC transporter permease [Micromonospora eburnea]|uniref:ABC-2 type transport system permease protein n=1 Tax=Micromonospora eburnea TaxID=227316 RepID=A0A1C6UH17_9ACTN|nr:hypothetical protein [Micromonospora eburnea]SCL53356.1 ABC-2 type transport system permease protein [Micromonospora eburnea]
MSELVGTWRLARLALRRDRIGLPVWTLLAISLAAGPAGSLADVYASAEKQREYAEGIGSNPAAAVFSGPSIGVEHLGGIVVKESAVWVLLLVAITSLMLVVRYTRTEEESGRAELVTAAAVGRHARLAAALLVVGVADLVIGLGTAAGLMGAGLPGTGSLAYGLGVTMVGLVFATVAAVTAQLVEAARTANGIALAVFGATFLLRGIADSASVANDGTGGTRQLAWVSPTGWFYQLRPYAGERWWVLGLAVVTGAVLTGVAVSLSQRRDIGAGLLAARLGPPDAKPGLATPLALAWRLQRSGLIAWAAGVAVGAAVLGSLAYDITDMVGSNDTAAKTIRQLGGADVLVDSYLVWVLRILGLAAAAYAVSAVLRLRSEESGLRAEPVLAAAVTRTRYALSHLLVAVVGVVVLLLTAGLVVGLVHGARSGDVGGELPRILGASLVQLPAALLPAALAGALFGLLPGATLVAWLFVGAILLIAQLGPVLELNQWVMDVSPFTHLPRLPGGDVTAMPLIWLGALVLLLGVAGLATFRRRDLDTA